MNSYTKIDANLADEDAGDAQMPVPRATLEQMEAWRSDALKLFGEAHDLIQEAMLRATLATGTTVLVRPDIEDGYRGGISFDEQ